MLALNPKDIFNEESILLKNKINGKYTFSKACSLNDNICFELCVERQLGVYLPKFFLRGDGTGFLFCEDFRYICSDETYDIYELYIDIKSICKEPGLLFYKISFSIGDNTIYFISRNNVSGRLTYSPDGLGEFKMLVYDGSFRTPLWFRESIMYHIFVDRFCKGDAIKEKYKKEIPIRRDAEINDDWYEGIPQYGKKQGDFCKNNMFFGGTLYGVCEKLDYLESLGIGTIYLSPVFEAYSNHKYDTGDYEKVDLMFGGDEALDVLISECKKRNIHIILDGVFNHTGDDSVYFNKYGRYGEDGAYRKYDSVYHDWYFFTEYPDHYESWWGITILPKLNTSNPKVEDFLAGENGIAAKYLKRGISGYRLDVADELPEKFLERLRKTVKGEDPEAVIIGEVWENAADKCAYGRRRKYFQGKQLDGVMNYPLKDGIISFINKGDSNKLWDVVCDIYSSYPTQASEALMNILGTHDTERIMTVLAAEREIPKDGDELVHFLLNNSEYEIGKIKLKCASVLQYTLPGVPSVFYGDEAGVSGGRDPFCRKTYPWGREDKEILSHYRKLGRIRRSEKLLCHGDLDIICHKNGLFAFTRSGEEGSITVAVNSGTECTLMPLPEKAKIIYDMRCSHSEKNTIIMERFSFAIIKDDKNQA